MNLITFNCKILIESKKCINLHCIYHKDTNISLLEMLKKYPIPIHYQCQAGYCGSCRITLISGKIKYHKEPLSYMNANEILLCCCFPTEDIILKL